MDVPIKVRRFMERIVLRLRKSGESLHKKRRRSKERRLFSGWRGSEVKTQAELHAPRRVCASKVHEIGVAQGRTDRARAIAKLSVIKDVERLPLEVETGPFIDRESFGKAEVKVKATRQIQSVASDIAERESGGYGECRGIEKERSKCAGLLVRAETRMRVAYQVRSGAGCGDAIANSSVIAKIGAIRDGERGSCLRAGYARDLPTPQHI